MAEHNQREDAETQGVETQASASKRRPRLNEAPTPPTPEQAEEESRGRSELWPAQYEGDGWDQVPVQMRPQS